MLLFFDRYTRYTMETIWFQIDLVTGRIVFSVTHKRVTGPYHDVHSENWAVYTYYNEKLRRAELGSLELFEGKTQTNSTVFSSLHNNVSPLVERQSYILGKSFLFFGNTCLVQVWDREHLSWN